MEELFKVTLNLDRHSSKKNEKVARRRGKSLFIGKSEKALSAEIKMMKQLVLARQKLKETIKEDISAKFTFIFPKSVYFTKQGERSKKLPDLSNLYELPQDCLQKSQIIENDTQICSHDGSRRVAGDSYQLVIILYKLKD